MSDGRLKTFFGRALKFSIVLILCIASGLIGGWISRLHGGHDFVLEYADFVSIMLTAASLLITVLAVFLAVAGFVGWTTIEQKVHGKTEDFLAKGLEKGGRLHHMIVEMIERKTDETMYRGVEPVGEDEPLSQEQDKKQ